MKKIILLLLMMIAMTPSVFSERQQQCLSTHKKGSESINIGKDRDPITLPISVYYDSETNILEVWCADDNIQAEVLVFDESGAVEAYSACMNVTLKLSSSNTHSIHLIGDGWEAEGNI